MEGLNWVVPTLAATMLEGVLGQLIKMDPYWSVHAKALSAQVIELELTDLPFHHYFLPSESGLVVQSSFPGKADVRISGSASGFIQLIQARRKGETLIGSDVQFEGDVAVGQGFEKLMASLNPLWEETFSRVAGDPLAHGASQLLNSLGDFFSHSMGSLAKNTKDYIQEEARFSPAAIEIQNFSDDIGVLRSDFSRLEARFRRLNSNQKREKKSTNKESMG